MPGIPFWTDLVPNPDPQSFTIPPDVWSVVYLGSNQSSPIPGILDNGDVHWKKHPHRIMQKNKSPSADGENPVWLGFAVAEFDLHMIIWTRKQLTDLQNLLPTIYPGSTGPNARTKGISTNIAAAASLGNVGAGLNLTNVGPAGGPAYTAYATDGPQVISHPGLALVNITSCLIEGFTPPVRWGGKNDIKRYTFHCREFRPAVSKGSPTPAQVNTPPIDSRVLPATTASTRPSQNQAGPSPAL